MKKRIISASLSAAMLLTGALSAAAVPSVTASADTNDYGLAERTADGVILHCFNWSYNAIRENLPEIAAAGYNTVQTSPVQQPKDYGEWLNSEGQWWKLYQPLSFTIATENTWLGTKDELAELCAEAEKYGIKVICDIVSNHMANQSGGVYLTVCRDIKNYEPDIYKNQKETFHQLKKGTDDDNKLEWIVQGELSYLPDLNTSNPIVQDRVISLLKECIDVGVDGFRFDAAKHIETPADGEFASDFWPNVTSAAREYAASKNTDLYMYGEVLNTPGKGRSTTDYTQYIDLIDNKMGNGVLAYVQRKNAKMVATALNYTYSYDDPSNFVVWAESHDTYMDGATAGVSNEYIAQTWALVNSRALSRALYLARPNELMGLAGDTYWKSSVITEINRFHNKFVGTDEEVYYDGDVVAVQRGDSGIVLVNLGDSTSISVDSSDMKDGTYTDAITGGAFTVSGGKISGTVGESGIAVVYNDAAAAPKVYFSAENESFRRDTYPLTLTLANAQKGTYSIDGGAAVEFTGSTSFTIGENVAPGSDIKVTATAINGDKTYTEEHTYHKEDFEHSGVFVYYDNSETNYPTVFAYGYYEYFDENGRKVPVTHDGQWPGTKMEYDAEKGLYVYEVPSDIPIGKGSVIITNAQAKGKFETEGMTIPAKESIYDPKQKKLVDLNGTTLIYGDVTGDSSIEADDALSVLRYTTGMEADFTDAQKAQADVDGDKDITAADALAILRFSVGVSDTTNHTGEEFTFGGSSSGPSDPTSSSMFYAVNGAGWIFRDGCKLWVVNKDTGEAIEMEKEDQANDDSKYASVALPSGWKNLELHRTQYNLTIEESEGDSAHMVWDCGEKADDKNSYKITDNNVGRYGIYDPDTNKFSKK